MQGGINIKKKTLKRSILALSTAAVILGITQCGADYVYNPTYSIMEENTKGPFACYSCGYVYIGNKKYLNSLTDLTEDDILVLDDRFDDEDPGVKIYSSYRITDKEIRNEILEILCEYEKCYPSPWERSIETMRLEWLIHNIFYDLSIIKERTGDVDLNNADENIYDIPALRKILKQ